MERFLRTWPIRYRYLGTAEGLIHWPLGVPTDMEDLLERVTQSPTWIACNNRAQQKAILALLAGTSAWTGNVPLVLRNVGGNALVEDPERKPEHLDPCNALQALIREPEPGRIRESLVILCDALQDRTVRLILTDAVHALPPRVEYALRELRERKRLEAVGVTGRFLRNGEIESSLFPPEETGLFLLEAQTARDVMAEGLGPHNAKWERTIAFTGGDPDFLDRLLLELGEDESEPFPEPVRETSVQILQNGPSPRITVRRKQLMAVLREEPRLIGAFREYVQGRRDPPRELPRNLAPLVATGWIGGASKDGSWGIRSWLHQGFVLGLCRELEQEAAQR